MIVNGLLKAAPGRQVTPEREGSAASAAADRVSVASAEEGRAVISEFFIERPIFANVIAFVTIIIGGVFLYRLPVAQYPEIVPPTIQVSTRYPGASAEVVAATIGVPLEQAINGVESSIYMSSTSASDGSYTLTITFDVGTDLDTSLSLVQNRVQQRPGSASGRRPVAGRHRPEGLPQHPAGGEPLFRRRPVRRDLPLQLRDHQHHEPARPDPGRRPDEGVRSRLLQHAGLAGPEAAADLRPHDDGRADRHPGAERRGRGRAARRPRRCPRISRSSSRSTPSGGCPTRASSGRSSIKAAERAPRPRSCGCATSPGWS